MKHVEIARRRLAAQQLVDPPVATPAEVVARLGAVQAQDYAGAKWALGLRGRGIDDAACERAMAEGAIVRTHVLRPTWHFVARDDLRWLLALTGPRILSGMPGRHRQLGLDDATLKKSRAVLERALAGGRHHTRAELAAVLQRARIATDAQRLPHILMHAELQQVICSGPVRGRQFTWALLDERVSTMPSIARDEAVTELARRYYTTHGPATAHDFAWWSGLTVGDGRRGAEALGATLERVEVEGTVYWHDPAVAPAPAGQVHLLPAYDEQFVGFKDRSQLLERLERAGRTTESRGIFAHTITVDGQFVGSWAKVLKRSRVVVELAPLVPLSKVQRRAMERAAEAYGAFLGVEVDVAEVAHA
jgi:hypothetical protein